MREKLERNFLILDFLPVRVSLFCQPELQQLLLDRSWCKYGSCVACFHFLLRPLGPPEPWSAALTALVPAAIRQRTLSDAPTDVFSPGCVLLPLQCLILNA